MTVGTLTVQKLVYSGDVLEPWKEQAAQVQLQKVVNVQVADCVQQDFSRTQPLVMHFKDAMLTYTLPVKIAFVYDHDVDFARLTRAAEVLLRKYPFLAGRYNCFGKWPTLESNNVGLPVTLLRWQEGSESAFPEALTATNFEGRIPDTLHGPAFFDTIRGDEIAFNGAPPFTLRLTQLGDGGSVLTANASHMLVDGRGMITVLRDLAIAYREGHLPPATVHLDRTALDPLPFTAALPNGDALLAEARNNFAGGTNGSDNPATSQAASFMETLAQAYARQGTTLPLADLPWTPQPELGPGPHRLSWTIAEFPRSNLKSLREAVVAQLSPHHRDIGISANDILGGLIWCLRCIFAESPLPGQGPTADIGAVLVDLRHNVPFTKADYLHDYMGNAAFLTPLVLPATGPNGEPIPAGYGVESLVQSVGVYAVACREAINDWRNPEGQSVKEFLNSVMDPNRFNTAWDLLKAVLFPGRQLVFRSLVTNWDRFPIEQIDFGSGPPQQMAPHWPHVSDWATFITKGVDCQGMETMQAHMFAPTKRLAAAEEALKAVVPGFTFRGA